MKKLSFYAHSFGCKSNIYEIEAISQYLRGEGLAQVTEQEAADLIIFNTCAVTSEAGRKARQALRSARKANEKAVILAMGCYSQLEDLAGLADFSAGTGSRLPAVKAAVRQLRERTKLEADCHEDRLNQQKRSFRERSDVYEELGTISEQSETRAHIKIADGCEQYCAYCAICLARGKVRSREREAILREAEALVEAGHKEIVLTATNLTAFEQEKGDEGLALAELLEALAQIPGLLRLRLGSLEPQRLIPEAIARLGRISKLCPHFHMSLQSGSDKILNKMERGYSTSDYRKIVADLRKHFSELSLTTDIMVGFPGEEEADFQDSLDFAEEIGFSRIHVFRYSPRPGTKAARMPQVDEQIKKERSQRLQELADRLAEEQAEAQRGKEVEIILEKEQVQERLAELRDMQDFSRKSELKNAVKVYSGHTANYFPVEIYLSEEQSQELKQGSFGRAEVLTNKGEILILRLKS